MVTHHCLVTMDSWADFLNFLKVHQIGDLAGLVGIAISIIGFIVTIYGVLKAKSAADASKIAAESARDSIRIFDTVIDFTAIIAELEDIKRIHRKPNSELLLDRYSSIRKSLITLKTNGGDLSEDHHVKLQIAINDLVGFEKTVEKCENDFTKINPLRFNAIISRNIDSLLLALLEIKSGRLGL